MPNEEITKHGVLVVDPSTHGAGLVSIMLRSLGRKDIREAYDTEKAMAELNRRGFSVVILDDGPGFDGVALSRKLRACAECQNRSVPIIMMSSAPDAKRIAEARDAGITEFLRKPFAANHLQTRLSSIVINPRGFINQGGEYNGPDRRRKVVDVAEDRRGSAKAG